jgi:uncharacterized protein with LGFP repeats
MLIIVACSSIAVGFQDCREIGKKWQSLEGQNGFLGAPLNDETGIPDGVGRYNPFQGGSTIGNPKQGRIKSISPEEVASNGQRRSIAGWLLAEGHHGS